jgi:hypothetical protein
VRNEGRQVEEELGARGGNQLQAFAVVVDPDMGNGRGSFAQEVGAELLFETGRDGGKRRDPMWLFRLRAGGASLPSGDKGILRSNG